MKKGIILCIMVLFMTSAVLTAQVPEWQWATRTGGISHDYCFGISVDADGNSYITGKFKGTATFGDDSITSSGLDDIFVAKLDTDGNWQWAKQAGGSYYDWGEGISVDTDGNSYVTGWFEGTAFFGADSLTSSEDQDDDIFVAKLDADGNWLWVKGAGGIADDDGRGISIDAAGNSYITGIFKETATFGAFTLTSIDYFDVFVAKLGTDGNWQWAEQVGGPGADFSNGISLDADGNSYVAG